MKRLLLIALLLLCPVALVNADQPTPDMYFEEATLTDFTMIGVGTWVCTYNVMVNHALPGNECNPRKGQWAVINTNFITMTMTWADVDLVDAVPGGTACLYWYCYANVGEMLYGTDEVGVASPNILYLPSVLKI